jgi:hypothetical protein
MQAASALFRGSRNNIFFTIRVPPGQKKQILFNSSSLVEDHNCSEEIYLSPQWGLGNEFN